jgi:hypothetical protein
MALLSFSQIFLLLISFLSLLYLLLPYLTPSSSSPSSSTSSSLSLAHTTADIEKMIQIIQLQNQTIHTLATHSSPSSSSPLASSSASSSSHGMDLTKDSKDLLVLLQEKEYEIFLLKQKLATQQQSPLPPPLSSSPLGTSTSSAPSPAYPLSVPMTSFTSDCEMRYGMQLIDQWKASKQVWCTSPDSVPSRDRSELVCYPYTQKHKSSPDVFCEATNFVIDFSKISGGHSSGKAPRGDQYLGFDSGSLLATCQKTKAYRNFMPHQTLQVRLPLLHPPTPRPRSLHEHNPLLVF